MTTEIGARITESRMHRDNGLGNRVILVGCRSKGEPVERTDDSLEELALLADTAGAVVIKMIQYEVGRITAAHYIGSGQAHILAKAVNETEADFIIFDIDLAPTQQRNIEKITERMVMDRTGIILDIFASRARTKEGKLQVELAQLEYLLPRLRGMWVHHLGSRQGAGIGTRGPGETELETDKRRISQKIARLKRELQKVKKTRALHRRSRKAVPFPTAVLVGYTNAGKSTLLNSLTNAGVFVEDKLFATLDPTVREFRLPKGDRVLISDTVGFIRKLPHQLVESFSATFEEIGFAEVLLHVVDISHPLAGDHIETTWEVLSQIGVDKEKIIMVFNKSDKLEGAAAKATFRRHYPKAVWTSALTKEGFEDLTISLSSMLSKGRRPLDIFVPYTAKEAINKINKQAKVLDIEYVEDGIKMRIEADAKLDFALREFMV